MTPEEFESKMRDIISSDKIRPIIEAHEKGDALMYEVLRELGYGAGVSLLEDENKFYA